MTISGTVIMLEAAGNMVYLLPLMVTFGAARYTGNCKVADAFFVLCSFILVNCRP